MENAQVGTIILSWGLEMPNLISSLHVWRSVLSSAVVAGRRKV